MKQGTPYPVGITPASDRKAAAEAWINSVTWKTFRLVSGRRLTAQGSRTRTTYTIFATGCPLYALKEVIMALAAQTPVRDVLVDGYVREGEWHHKSAWWQRDDRGASQGDATLTVYRVFSDGDVEEEGVVEDGCSERTTIRYVFDVDGIEDISADPNHGRQGFAVKLGGVSRDPETGLMSYYVTTTEQLTVHTPEYVTNDDAFMTEYTEEWSGLRGTQAAPVDSDGVAVAVPNPLGTAKGTTMQVRWEKDPQFCTWRLRAVKRIAKQDVEGASACDVDLFKEQDTQETRAQLTKLGHAPEAADGLSVQHSSRPREDELWDNTVQNNQEHEVAEAVKSVTVTQRAVITEIQDVNRAALPMPADSEIGVTVTNQKTPGNWFRRTRREVRIRILALLRLLYREDLFKREYSETRVKAAPDSDPGFPGGGLSLTTDSRLNEDNNWDVTRAEDREKPVSEARKTVSVTQRSVITEVQDVATIPLVYPTDAEIGATVTNQKTPGGIWQRTYRNVRIRLLALLRQVYAETLYKKEESSTTVLATPAVDPGFPGGGLSLTTDSRLNEDNNWDVTRAEDREKPVSEARKTVSVTQRSVITEVQDVATIPLVYPTDAEIGATVTNQKTPGGIWQRTYRNVRIRLLALLRQVYAETLYKKEESSTTVLATPAVDPGFAAGGLTKTTDSRLNEDNNWDVTRAQDQEKLVERSQVRKTVGLGIITTRVTDTQSTNGAEDLPAGVEGALLEIEKTPGNLRNRTLVTYSLAPGAEGKITRHSKGGDFRTNYETTVSLASAKVFSADCGLTNAGQANAVIVEETFELGEDGVWRKSRKVTTPAGIERNMFGRFAYEDTLYNAETKKNEVYDVDYYRRQWVNMTVANAEALIINSQANEDLAAIELGFGFNDFGLLDGSQTMETRSLKP